MTEPAPGPPWPALVRFHKDIVKRAEEGFFALPAHAPDSDRWSSLVQFQPDSMSGPWTIRKQQVRSQDLLRGWESGRHTELYLGGPGFFGFRKVNNQWMPLWKPVLYRHVRLEDDGNGGLTVVPAQGTWEFSPLVLKLLDSRSIALDEAPDDIVTALLEDAAGRASDGLPLSQRVLRGFIATFPELEGDIAATANLQERPSPWVLFAPPSAVGPTLQYLMGDYDRLDQHLSAHPDLRGGLAVLDGGPQPGPQTGCEVLPVVPLTESQHDAVSAALAGRPLTVVSGPPGCGKSQVVVSLLLNAWARGLTVLFASNNNRAVDVVRERLQPFESEVPIAARAGAYQFNEVTSVLSRVAGIVGTAGAPVDLGANSERGRRLEQERRELLQCLATNVPQRVDEALRSALKGYAGYRETLQALERVRGHFVASVVDLGYSDIDAPRIQEMADALSTWLDEGIEAAEQANRNERERTVLNQEMERHGASRDEACGAAGLNPGSQEAWDWLVAGGGPELLYGAWSTLKTLLLTRAFETEVAPIDWDGAWDPWRSSDHASEEEHQLRQLAADTRTACGELTPKLAQIAATEEALDGAKNAARAVGLDIEPRCTVDVLDAWEATFADFVMLPSTWTAALPWSQKARARRALETAEKEMRPAFPLAVWRRVGELSLDGRRRLSEVVDVGRQWLRCARDVEGLSPIRREVNERLGALRGRAALLRLPGVPVGADLEEWRRLGDAVEEQGCLAQAAVVAWRQRETRDDAWTCLKEASGQLLRAVAGQPLWEAWTTGQGKPFTIAISALGRKPSPGDITVARGHCHGDPVAGFLEHWKHAKAAEDDRRSVAASITALPTRSSIQKRWSRKRPSWLLGGIGTGSAFPTDGDELHAHLTSVNDRAREWRQLTSTTLPELREKADDERRWALEQLASALTQVPAGGARDSIEPLVKSVLTAPDDAWPVNQLIDAFSSFNPTRIKADLGKLDGQLGRLSFQAATAAWVERLQNDPDTLRALDRLRHALQLSRGRLDAEHYADFRRALRGVPIWITTAQAAQSVPVEPTLFDLVVIDEASQCTLTNLLPLLFRGSRLVVIGDQRQLPAIPDIGEVEQAQLARAHGVEAWMSSLGHATNDVFDTATQALPRRQADVVQLVDHFRSHPSIIGFSNREVYHRSLRLRRDPLSVKAVPFGHGVHVKHVAGQAERGPNNRSWVNRLEAEEVVKLVAEFRQAGGVGLDLGVVTPFRPQEDLIVDRLGAEGLLDRVTVGTAYKYQGDERDAVIFSPVVAPGITAAAARWVEEPFNLINVAATRGRESFWLVGHLDACRQQQGILGKLTRYCETGALLRRTSDAELELFGWMAMRGWTPEVHVVVGDIEVDFILRNDGISVVVEVDGRQHEESTEADKARDAFLAARGCRVLRVRARAVRETPANVLDQIAEACGMNRGAEVAVS